MGRALRVGLIGAGGIAGAHLRAYQQFPDLVRLVAVADPREEAARQRAAESGAEQVYRDPYRLIREAGVEAVDICTPHDQHAPLAVAAAEAGLHVLVEKPMACSMQECRDMVEAGRRAGVALMVAQCQRYSPGHRGVKKALDAGELGRIFSVQFDSMQNICAFLPPTHWLYDGKQSGGGIVISVSVHKIDLMRYFLGDVRRVSAVCKVMRPGFVNGAEDYAAATLEFESGAIGSHFATYSGYRMPWSEKFLILGEKGALHDTQIASDLRPGEASGWGKQFAGFVPVEPDHEGLPTDDAFINEVLHWAECCRTGSEPLTSGRDNLDTMRVIFGIYESSRLGAPVDLATV
jgi:predicted dehydrogenase